MCYWCLVSFWLVYIGLYYNIGYYWRWGCVWFMVDYGVYKFLIEGGTKGY